MACFVPIRFCNHQRSLARLVRLGKAGHADNAGANLTLGSYWLKENLNCPMPACQLHPMYGFTPAEEGYPIKSGLDGCTHGPTAV